MRLVVVLVLAGTFVFLGVHLWSFAARSEAARGSLVELQARLNRAEADRRVLEADAAYAANPANLEKELRGRFNYRAPGETMIVIIPGQSSTPSSSR